MNPALGLKSTYYLVHSIGDTRRTEERLHHPRSDGEVVQILVHVQRLFPVERAITQRAQRLELNFESLVELRRQVRGRRAGKLPESIQAEAEALSRARSTLPKSKLGKALAYLDGQRGPLSVFVGDPRLPIHNNDSERDLRHVAVGRKYWLIFASPRGGEVACRLYSLVLSCKQSGVDPEAYIEDVLGAVSTTLATRIAELTPWAWAARQPAGTR